MTKHRWLQGVVNWWAMHPCPECGKMQNPFWLTILDSYSVSCGECGALLETFELYTNAQGHARARAHWRGPWWRQGSGVSI
jgi:hypothetical protein